MRAARILAPHDLRVEDLRTPSPGPGQVRVDVGAVGVCAGDLYFYTGHNPYATYPMVCGHEIAGTVAELGPGAAGPAPGTLVAIDPFLACGSCYACRVGRANCCADLRIIGVHLDGGFADSVVVPADHAHPVPDGLSPTLASFAEPVAIGIQVVRRAAIARGEIVLLIGCGPIGLAVLEVAGAVGARVLATDLNPQRVAMAARLGAEPLPPGDELEGALAHATQGEGAPVVIEATGSTKAMEQGADLVATAGRLVIVGLTQQDASVRLPAFPIIRKEMTILGSRASLKAIPDALKLLSSGVITYPRVASEFDLEAAPRVFADLVRGSGGIHKAVFVRRRGRDG